MRPVRLMPAVRLLSGSELAELARREGSVAAGHDLMEPVCYEPAELSVEELIYRAKRDSLLHSNYFYALDQDPTAARFFGLPVIRHLLARLPQSGVSVAQQYR